MFRTRVYWVVAAMFALAIFLGACQPAALLSNTAGKTGESATTGGTAASAAAAGELADAGRVGEGATATVTARSLRVRSAPNETAEVVAGIKEGEQYSVLGLSGDGLWAELEIPQAPGGSGWVSINFVSVAGPITDAATSDAALTPVPTPQAGYAVIQPVSPRLRVRAEPNTEAEIVGYAFTGQSFPVEEISADGQWVKISGVEGSENPNGGWVTADFVAVGE